MRSIDWAQLAWTCLAFALALLLGAAIGYQICAQKMGPKIGAAQTDAARCADAATSQQAVIDDLRQRARKQTAQLVAAKHVADAAMQARDNLQRKVAAQAAKSETHLRQVAHDDPSCADLARMPICPAVADSVWPAQAATDPPPDH